MAVLARVGDGHLVAEMFAERAQITLCAFGVEMSGRFHGGVPRVARNIYSRRIDRGIHGIQK